MKREKVHRFLKQARKVEIEHESPADEAEIRYTTKQWYWDYQNFLENPDGSVATKADIHKARERTLFDHMKENLTVIIEDDIEVLRFPEVHRLAEYFGVIPTEESGYEEYRGFQERRMPILLPSEEGYYVAKEKNRQRVVKKVSQAND